MKRFKFLFTLILIIAMAVFAVGCNGFTFNLRRTADIEITADNTDDGKNNNPSEEPGEDPGNDPGNDPGDDPTEEPGNTETINVKSTEEIKASITNFSFQYIVIQEGEYQENTITLKVCPDGISFTTEDGSTIINYANNKAYMVNFEDKQVIAMTLNPDIERDPYEMFIQNQELYENELTTFKKIGTENLDGNVCSVYESPLFDGNNNKVRIYITSDGIVLKIVEVEQNNKETNGFYLKNFKIGNVQKSDMNPPAGFEVTDISDLGNM